MHYRFIAVQYLHTQCMLRTWSESQTICGIQVTKNSRLTCEDMNC
ncbi:hypothetical protein NP493_237g01021 [Ridgeia piscesae]|uniref:Uncharacterized protein n=1 Tax=Ridgeia piscesae TaxID=27915 RepID=A0AAD9UDG3_RIDPI|nr:hypothetical protein NP493_237g01021 [Ridgeia piscesae]